MCAIDNYLRFPSRSFGPGAKGGNAVCPDGAMCRLAARLQLPECMEILKEEIDTWKPNLILIETDESWFSGFSPLFSSIEIARNPVVKVVARYKKTPVLVTIRPERQSKEKFISNILEVLDEIRS